MCASKVKSYHLLMGPRERVLDADSYLLINLPRGQETHGGDQENVFYNGR